MRAVNRGNETVSAAGDGFDETRAGGRVAERFANLVYSRIQAVIEVDEGVGGPDFLAQVFTRNDTSSVFEQGGENLKGLLLQPEAPAILTKFPGSQINLKHAEAEQLCFAVGGRRGHDSRPVYTAGHRSFVASRRSLAITFADRHLLFAVANDQRQTTDDHLAAKRLQ